MTMQVFGDKNYDAMKKYEEINFNVLWLITRLFNTPKLNKENPMLLFTRLLERQRWFSSSGNVRRNSS